jgi:hypothetical protein
MKAGIEMRATLLVLLCTFSGAALAQSTDCTSIPNASERLACYGKAAPPATKSKANPPTNAAAPEQKGRFIDQLAIENKHLDDSAKTICRGC